MESNDLINDFKNIPYYQRHRIHIWEEFFKKYKIKKVCEVGVREGKNFRQMINHDPEEAVAVDCWIDDGVLGRNDICLDQPDLNKQYLKFQEEFDKLPFVRIIRGYSFDAVKQFPTEYFDFVYIDADHTFEGCYRDICDWYPKVKKGGILAGHDFNERLARTRRGKLRFGVVEAVNKFAKENNLEFFILKPTVWGIIKP